MLAYLTKLGDSGLPQRWDNPRNLALRLVECGDWMRFRHFTDEDDVRLVGASFCKQHLACALCAVRRGAKFLQSYLPKFEEIRKAHPKAHVELVTLTVKNGFDLTSRFLHLKNCWQSLHHRRHLERSNSTLQKAGFLGAVWSYEVTNIGNGWHPHLHAIVISEHGVDPLDLTAEWHRLTQDSFVTDVRPLALEDPAAAFCEVFKYAVKFNELSLSDRWEAFVVLRGRRLVASAGVFRGVQVPDELTDEELEGRYVDYFYRFLHKAGVYSL